MASSTFRRLKLAKSIRAASLYAGSGVIAATGVAAIPAIAQSEFALEEVVVTARKKEESLQDVPVAVSALSGEAISTFGLDNIQAMGDRIPSLQIHTGGSGQGASIYLRGIGSAASAGAFEPSAALNFDGAVGSTARVLTNSFFDLAAFEVLKGPQPLFFGKGATAGVLSLRSNDPTPTFEGSVMLGYEFEEDAPSAQLVLSGPISDTLGYRVAARTKKVDEEAENLAQGVKNGYRGVESTDARLTLDWQPTDSLRANLKVNYHDYEDDGPIKFSRSICIGEGDAGNVNGCDGVTDPDDPGLLPWTGNTPDGAIAVYDAAAAAAGGNNLYIGDGVPYQESETWNTRLLIDWGITDNIDLISTTAYLDIDQNDLENYAWVISAAGTSGQANEFEVFTQEFRLEANYDRFRVMLGAFYEDHSQLFAAEQYVGLAALFPADTPGFEGSTYDVSKAHETDSDTYSYFGSVEFDITDKLTASVGVRYTDVERDGTITLPYANPGLNALLAGNMGITTGPGNGCDDAIEGATGACVPYPFIPGGVDVEGGANETWQSGPIKYEEDETTPEVVLSYLLTEDSTVYIAYKEAFKPGGIANGNGAFSPDLAVGKATGWIPGDGTVFLSETVDGYEIGYKSELLDNTLRFNATWWDYIYDDYQVQTFRGLSFQTQNAGKLKSQGIEAEFVWAAPVNGLQLYGSLVWDNSEFDEFFNTETERDLSGRRLAQSPEYSGNFGVDYFTSISDGLNLDIRYNLNFKDEYWTNNLGRKGESKDIQDSYTTSDLAVSLMSADESWVITLAGSNIFDEYYAVYSGSRVQSVDELDDKDITTYENRGRTVTLQATYNF